VIIALVFWFILIDLTYRLASPSASWAFVWVYPFVLAVSMH